MSSETINPIDPARFALALQDLPLDALHAKAAELQNSIGHLRYSNEQMVPFADDGDQDCKDAMFENLGVIGRINERIRLIRDEVERRGMPWPGSGEGADAKDAPDSEMEHVNGDAGTHVNGAVTRTGEGSTRSGRLTDEELRRMVEAQMDDAGEEDGVHL